VGNKRTDIQQIRKYLNGELDAKAMHQLEREAQDDPFLMDALEGYADAAGQQDNLDELSRRLGGRTDKKVKRLIPWATISIAATIIGFLVVVGLLFKQNANEKPALQTAQLQPAEKAPLQKDIAAPVIADKEKAVEPAKPRANAFVAPRVIADENESIAKKRVNDAPPVLNEVAVSSAATPLEDRVMDYVAAQKADTVNMPGTVAVKKPVYSQQLAGRVSGVKATAAVGKKNSGYYLPGVNLPPDVVQGVVLSRDDGQPLPGVTVKVDGQAKGTQTDANGKFVLSGVKDKDVASFGYIGFEPQKVNLRPADSIKVELNSSSASLSEVVVVRNTKPIAEAHPQIGWGGYNEYLQQNAVLPAGAKTGTIRVKFTVNTDGSLTGIKALNSLSPVANEQAISIIRNGPAWAANKNGKAEEVTVKLTFVNSQ
jgi:TonB family protein